MDGEKTQTLGIPYLANLKKTPNTFPDIMYCRELLFQPGTEVPEKGMVVVVPVQANLIPTRRVKLRRNQRELASRELRDIPSTNVPW